MTRARIVLIALQLVYLNGVLICGATLQEVLPRFFNVLLGYFIGPIVLLIVFNSVATRVFAALKIKLHNEDAPVTAFGIVAVTAWLGLVVGSWLNVFDYVALSLGERVEDLDPAETLSHPDAVHFSFTSGVLASDHVGLERQRSQVKSADVVTKTYHDYTAVPFVAASWKPGQPIGVWFCRWSSGLHELPASVVLEGALEEVPPVATHEAPVYALRWRDPATRSNCAAAIEQAGASTGAQPHPEALILQFTSEDPEALLAGRAVRFWWFLGFYEFLWLLPALFVGLDPGPEDHEFVPSDP